MMNAGNKQYQYYRQLYEKETNPTIKNKLKEILDMTERDVSSRQPEEIPDDQVHSPPDIFGVASQKEGSKLPPMFDPPESQLDESPYTPTTTNKNIANAIKGDDEFVTKGDNLEAGSSADNPIDSKSLTYEAQAQLPIGTWVTTSKGPHRINQGDINWAKQQMSRGKTSTAGQSEEIPDDQVHSPVNEFDDTSAEGTATDKPAKQNTAKTKPTQYTTKPLSEEQVAQMTDPKRKLETARAKQRAEDDAKKRGTSASYSLGDYEKELPGAAEVAFSATRTLDKVPIKQMPEVMDFFKDKNNYNLIKSVLGEGGSRRLNANLTAPQLRDLVDTGISRIGGSPAQKSAVTQLKKLLSDIYEAQTMAADYENFTKTGKVTRSYN